MPPFAIGTMKYIIAKLKQQIADLEKANGKFKESEPPVPGAGGAPNCRAGRRSWRPRAPNGDDHF